MKFGMPTLVECNDIYECVEVAKKYGLDYVEINMSFPQYLPNNLDVSVLKDITKKDNISFTIHADEMLNPFDFNPVVSNCYFNVMKDTINFAKQIGAPVINMHLLKGVYVTLPDKVLLLTDTYFKEYQNAVKNFIKMCEEEIGESNLKICIENVDSNPFTQSQLKVLPEFLNSDAFRLTLDTGHEFCLQQADSFVYKKYPEKLYHMHLHDAVGRSAHLPLGTGLIDIKQKIDQLQGETCTVEVKSIEGLKESMEYLKKNNLIR